MSIHAVLTASLAIVCSVLSGCATTRVSTPQATTVQVSYDLPTLAPVANSSPYQEKSGVRIVVTPYTFSATRKARFRYEQLPTRLVINDQYKYKEQEIPYYEIEPVVVLFKVKVYNTMSHILRLAGTVVSFQVAGRTVALEKAGYESFLTGIILPRQEMEYQIVGPSITSLPRNCTIALLFYDIVTRTNAAGNPTERSNFEWYYAYSIETVTKWETAGIREIKMTPEEATSVGAPFNRR